MNNQIIKDLIIKLQECYNYFLTNTSNAEKPNYETKAMLDLSQSTFETIYNSWYNALSTSDKSAQDIIKPLTNIFAKVNGITNYENAWKAIGMFLDESSRNNDADSDMFLPTYQLCIYNDKLHQLYIHRYDNSVTKWVVVPSVDELPSF